MSAGSGGLWQGALYDVSLKFLISIIFTFILFLHLLFPVAAGFLLISFPLVYTPSQGGLENVFSETPSPKGESVRMRNKRWCLEIFHTSASYRNTVLVMISILIRTDIREVI